jgi:hypothetical protein
MNVRMRGPIRVAVTAVPGMPSSWKDCNGLLTTEAIHINLDSARRSSVTSLPDVSVADASFPLVIPIKDLQSLEEIPISIVTRGRHALCLKYQNSQGSLCETHLSFSSKTQYTSWQSSVETAISECRTNSVVDFDYFALPPVHVALPPPPPHHPLRSDGMNRVDVPDLSNSSNFLSFSNDAFSSSLEVSDRSRMVHNSSPIKSISTIQAYLRSTLQRSKVTVYPLNQISSPDHVHLFHSNPSKASSVNQFAPSDSLDDYPTIMPLMNVLLSVQDRGSTLSTKNHPASVAVNLLRLNDKAAVAASIESKFETDTLVSSLKQSIHHLQTSKDDLCQEFENFKDVSKQSSHSFQILLDRKDDEISTLNTKLLQISRACGQEVDGAAQIIETISSLQEKVMLQSTSAFILQSELEFIRQNGTRATNLHASLIKTKDSEIENLTHALQTKDSEIEHLVACLQTESVKVQEYELANTHIRDDAIRHQLEADMHLSMHQHTTELKICGLLSERDTLSFANVKLNQDLQTKNFEYDQLHSSFRIQSDDLHKKNLEAEKLVLQLRKQADAAKDFELSIAHFSEEAARCHKEAESRLSAYKHNTDLKIQALSHSKDELQSAAATDAEVLSRFRDKYVAALADNSLLLETIRVLNNSVAQLQGQMSDLEKKLGAKDLEISSGKSCLQELIFETDSNRQLLHSAIDRHSQFIASRNSDIYDQVFSRKSQIRKLQQHQNYHVAGHFSI